MTAHEMRIELTRLLAERHKAAVGSLGGNETYMSELEEELEHCREAYVGLAVTEIATLRAELSGPQWG